MKNLFDYSNEDISKLEIINNNKGKEIYSNENVYDTVIASIRDIWEAKVEYTILEVTIDFYSKLKSTIVNRLISNGQLDRLPVLENLLPDNFNYRYHKKGHQYVSDEILFDIVSSIIKEEIMTDDLLIQKVNNAFIYINNYIIINIFRPLVNYNILNLEDEKIIVDLMVIYRDNIMNRIEYLVKYFYDNYKNKDILINHWWCI